MQLPFIEHVSNLILSTFQMLYIPTTEENRCLYELRAAVERVAAIPGQPTNMGIITWDACRGFTPSPAAKNIKDPVAALESLLGTSIADGACVSRVWGDTSALFVFYGLHDFFKDAVLRQCIRNLVTENGLNAYPTVPNPESQEEPLRGYRRPVAILAPTKDMHKDLQHCLTLVPFARPGYTQLAAMVDGMRDMLSARPQTDKSARVDCDAVLRERVIRATMGLREREAEDVLALSLRVNKGWNEPAAFKFSDGTANPGIAEMIADEKAAALQKSEVLSYIPADKLLSMEEVGGNDVLKAWIKRKAVALGPRGREFNLDPPRGVVLLGVPGTGKSKSVLAIAKALGLSLIQLNAARLGGSLVGESQQRTQDALDTVDAQDGCVLWIDEAEKVLAGSQGPDGTGGTQRQVFGMINTWLTEHTSRTFVVITLNSVAGLPPEFLRAGRYDQVFNVALPHSKMREEILRIHLIKRGCDMAAYAKGLRSLAECTDGFSGAELVQVVVDARERAVVDLQTGTPTLEMLLDVASRIRPLSVTRASEFEEMRRVAEEHGIYATSPEVPDPPQATTRNRRTPTI